MKLAELEEAVLRPMATGFRNLSDAMRAVPGLVGASPDVRVCRAFEQADIKMQELNHWLRDLRGMLVALTDEDKENVARQAAALEKAQREAAGVN